MNQPWNLRKDDTRKADNLYTFIIVCEDEVSEPLYFKYFETDLIKINPVENQKSKMTNVLNAITHCLGKDIMEYDDKNKLEIKRDDIQIWCVFDRDKGDDSKLEQDDVSFNEAIKTALEAGINVAWSNDAFELWVLLHFEEIEINDDNKKRDIYYKRLTDIFKKLPNPNEDLIKARKYSSFNYKQDLKHRNNFRNIVRNEIIPKTQEAINRAKALDKHFSASSLPYHQKAPCTMVYKLVEELLSLGKKNIV